jgi:hypothetical protein
MNKLDLLKNGFMKQAGKGVQTLKKYGPEILLGLGIIGGVSSTIMACRSTLEIDGILAEKQKKIDRIKNAKEELEDDYPDYDKDMMVAYVQSAVDVIKLYGPSVTLGVASMACILGSYGIMKKRNIAILAAYKAVEQSFTDYRRRVVEKYGKDDDNYFKTGVKKESVKTMDDNGKNIKVDKEVRDPNDVSVYARFFDESSKEWQKTPEYNFMFLKAQQNYMNDLLHARGHVFLNEVYDALGLPHSQAGSVVGWLAEDGDGFIDFGIFDEDSGKVRDFVNGYERSILLDSKAKTIEKYLGRRYTVKASLGHVRDLPRSQFGVDVDNGFEPKYITIRGKGEVLRELRDAAKKADRIFLATDPDREGEAIAWHLAQLLGIPGDDRSRVVFNEITKEAIQAAIKRPRTIDQPLVDAQQARRVLDRVVGYKLSPLLWRKVRRGLSAGRVQSTATRMIVDREREIKAFRPEEYWSISARLLTAAGKPFEARFHGFGDGKQELSSQAAVDAVLERISGQEFRVATIRKRERLTRISGR